MDLDRYIKKKSLERGLSVLSYTAAFMDGMKSKDQYYNDSCPKMLAAYKDGKRYKKRLDLKSSN